MKGKTLENLVLVVGLIVIGTAVFFMYFAPQMLAARLINVIFSLGFIIYIAYSYILSNNLNTEIRDLEKHVNNLKEEVGRQKATIAKRDASIVEKEGQLADLSTQLEELQVSLINANQELSDAKNRITELESSKEAS